MAYSRLADNGKYKLKNSFLSFWNLERVNMVDREMKIVASMLEKPTRENDEPILIY